MIASPRKRRSTPLRIDGVNRYNLRLNDRIRGASYGQHYTANHRNCRAASLRWRLVRSGTLVLVREQRDHHEDGRAGGV